MRPGRKLHQFLVLLWHSLDVWKYHISYTGPNLLLPGLSQTMHRAPSAHSQLGKVAHSQQSVNKIRHSRPGPKIWELSSSPCGLQDSEAALLQLSFGVWEGWRSQLRLWIVLSLVLLRNVSLFFFPSSAEDSFLGKETWGIEHEFSLILLDLVPRVDFMGKNRNLSAMKEPTMVVLMVIIGLWIFPTSLIFPCCKWPSSSCASSRCALQGSPGVSRSGRKPCEVSGSGNLGWKPWKWARVREILAGAEFLNSFFPMSWVWKSMSQHDVPGVQSKGKNKPAKDKHTTQPLWYSRLHNLGLFIRTRKRLICWNSAFHDSVVFPKWVKCYSRGYLGINII